MLVLGIESSCDETAVAVVDSGYRVLSNVIASQHKLHVEYGGVVPEIAGRAHVERIGLVLARALQEAGLEPGEMQAVAVGHKPGLIGALLVGVAAAKALAWSLEVPLIGVDHIHAHMYANLLDAGADHAAPQRSQDDADDSDGSLPRSFSEVFPALGLVISGGHTELYRLQDPVTVQLLGKTIDDAVGEAYDKVAAMLGLPHPGGPVLDKLARRGDARAYDFPVSRLGPESLDFSFSGLKTAVLYAVRGRPVPPPRHGKHHAQFERDGSQLSEQDKADVAASFQRAAAAALLLKLERALQRHPEARAVLVGGGVSANSKLRRELAQLGQARGVAIHVPRLDLCTDNAAMIAGLGHYALQAGMQSDLTLAPLATGRRRQ